jgi:hypothetical protein
MKAISIADQVNGHSGGFLIPLEGVTKAYAINGIRESGKSSLGTVMAEEYCKAKQPWIAFDPAGNWWGLRAKPDGTPGGFPVVVFGGERGDLPLEKDAGPKIAEAITRENVFAVIDLKMTSKTMWRTLVRDIVRTLQEIQVQVPRMVFIEEAQEFIPQKPSHQLGAECKEIVERLVTLGGNWGYGATILGQRPASIEKSALSQCETVFAFATQGKHDRDAIADWMDSQQVDEAARAALKQLADLPTGECYVWSPRFLKTFARLRIRRRETFHPRDARRLGVQVKDVELAPVEEFVAKVRTQLTKTVVQVCDVPKNPKTREALVRTAERVSAAGPRVTLQDVKQRRLELDVENLKRDLDQLKAENASLKESLSLERRKVGWADERLKAFRAHLGSQYQALQKLFAEMGDPAELSAGSTGDPKIWEPWLAKAGRMGCRRMLEALIQKGELTRSELGIHSHVASTKSTFRNYLSWLKSNGLIEIDGEKVRLKAV